MNAVTREVPVADWLDPGAMMQDPYPTYERLRRMGPVVFAPPIGRYLLTTHEAVSLAERMPEVFSSYSETNLTMMRALGYRPMLRKDDPEHAIERSSINSTLRPRGIGETWEPRFRVNVDRWLRRLREVGPNEADLNRDFAAPVASQNLIDMLGFPADVTVDQMHRWSTDFIAGIGNILDDQEIWQRCDESSLEVANVLDDLLPHLRRNPNSSLTSHLLEAGLSEQQVRANVHLTISGGMNEPQHVITASVWALGAHRPQLERVLGLPDADWGAVFEEVVRWVSPIGMLPRETTKAFELFGVEIPERANVGLLLASANRDAELFDRADEFDVRRNARGHLGFGSGTHMCAGRWAAKAAVGEIAVPELYRQLPSLRVDESRHVGWDGWVFRGLTSLPVTWDE